MENKISCSSGRAKLVDPNMYFGLSSSDNFSVPLEDLNVSVILRSFRKGRTLLTQDDNGGVSENIAKIEVNFIEGSELGGKKVLTSKFTDLTTVFDKNVINDETLGITSIDIEFNSSYVPMITINFVDVRGSSIFQNEENILNNTGNKYTTFFQLPYPMFELEVKGFYGLPVKYCLHMLKFNSKFNSKTGNFEISCQFVGYTFALLADMLLGYLRAIPYTTIGEQRLKQYKEDVNKPNLLTLDELAKKISEINKGLKRETEENPAAQQINTIQDGKAYVDSLRDRITTLGQTIDLNKKKTNYDYIIFKHVNDFNTDQKTAIDTVYIANSKTDIDAYNKLAEENYKLTEADFINIKTETNTNGGKLYKKLSKQLLTKDDATTNAELKTIFGCKDDSEVGKIKITLLDNINQFYKDAGLSDGEEIDVFDMTLLNKKIDELSLKLGDNLENSKITLAKDFANNVRETLTFEPTIRNIVEIFTAAIEVFAESIFQVSLSAEGNDERTAELAQKFTGTDINISDIHKVNLEEKKFFPWPDYREKEESTDKVVGDGGEDTSQNSSTYVEKYLGADGVLSNPAKVDELVFIEDLLLAFRKSYKSQQETINDAEKEETTWFPMNAFDSFIFSESEPYSRIEALNANDVARLMVIRAMTFFGYSYNPALLTEEDVAAFAQIEAEAMLRGIPDIKIRKSIIDASKNIDTFKNVKGTINGVERPVVAIGSGKVSYDYIFKDLEWKLIPINKGFNNESWEDKEYKLRQKRDNDGYIFFTNYGPSNDDANDKQFYKGDDGGIYVKIIETIQEPKTLSTPPPNVNVESVISYEKIKEDSVDKSAGFNPFGGAYGVQEFKTMEWNEQPLLGLPLMYVFYRNCDSGLALTRKASGTAQGLDFETTSDYFYIGKTSFEWPSDMEDVYLSHSGKYMHFNLGKNRDLFNLLINGGSADITYPYVEYKGGVPDTKWHGFTVLKEPRQPYTDNAFSLFGSDLYYRQSKYALIYTSDKKWKSCAEYSRAYLFLQTLPFNTHQAEQDPFYNKEILNLFRNSSGLIHAPRLWCAYIGSMIWRNSSADPIFDSSGKIIGGGGGAWENANGDERDPISWNTDVFNTPNRYEYTNYLDVSGDLNAVEYINVEPEHLINRLPVQVKDEFRRIFFEFVNGTGSGVKWRDIADKLEIYDTSDSDSYDGFRDYLEKNIDDNEDTTIMNSILYHTTTVNGKTYKPKADNIKSYYDIITPIEDTNGSMQDYFLFLELRDGTSAVKTLLNALTDEVIIVNSTYKIWTPSQGDKEREPISIDETLFSTYFGQVSKILETKSDENNPSKENEKADLAVFGTSNTDIIKLQLYRTCKNIYDKWLGGAKDINNLIFQCGGRSLTDSKLAAHYGGKEDKPRMIDSFRFVSRNFSDIGNLLYVNPLPINDTLLKNTNTSSYDMISNLLSANRFNFTPLPNFINFNDEKIMSSIFKPFNYMSDEIPKGACGPSFVCVYDGQPSKHLDYGPPSRFSEHSSKYPNDGFDLRCFNGNSLAPDAPGDIVTGNGPSDYEEPVSAFVVKYSQQNQNLFKDIELDQSEFSETDESLKIQDEISQKGAENNRAVAGQNIYNVYAVRSYTAKVDMMGNAMVQPMMFFQLDNIPMFHGAYLITKVSHSITPNSMSTNFQGTRIRYPQTRLVTSTELYMDLLQTFDTSGAGTGSIGDVTTGGGTIDAEFDVIPDKEVVGKFVNPFEGSAKITSIPGLRSLHGKTGNHKGIDFGIPVGRNLIAVYDGTIESIKFQEGGAGFYMVINHGVIGDKTYKTVYMHMSDIAQNIMGKTRESFTQADVDKILKGFNPNVKVKKGDVIGKSGGGGGPYLLNGKYNTSGRSTGPHLHWELRLGGKNDSGTNVFSLKPISGLRFIPAGKDYDYGDSGGADGKQTELGSAADYWSLVAICSLEAGLAQARADVAQSIYNRLGTPGKPYGKSIKEIIVAEKQYEPTFKNRNDWKAIKDEATAIVAVKKAKGWSDTQAKTALQESAKAIKDKTLQNNSKSFINTRTEFLGYYPKSSNAQQVVHRTSPSSGGGNGGNNYFYWEYAGKALINKPIPTPPDFSSFK